MSNRLLEKLRNRPLRRSTNLLPRRNHHRRLHCEALEDRRMLSIGPYPELPGMVLVDPVENQFQDQIVYLDFDGAEDVTYDGPVVVEDIDIPAFEAPGELAGQEQQIIADVVAQLEETFAGTGIIFTTTQPAPGTEYSTIYIGGDDSAFEEYGSFLGLAEAVDVGNQDQSDDGIVFTSSLQDDTTIDQESLSTATAELAAHELAHLLGYEHDEASSLERDQGSALDDVAYGVTFVTHGFLFDWQEFPDWVPGMAGAIAERIATTHNEQHPDDSETKEDVTILYFEVSHSGGTPFIKTDLCRYELATGGVAPIYGSSYDLFENSVDGEIVIMLDWSEAASMQGTTLVAEVKTGNIAQAVANYFYDSGGANALLEAPWHMIGHSRGGSVIGALAEDLGSWGLWMDQLTFLDPHPLANGFGNSDDDWGNDGMVVPDNVAYADNYWHWDINPADFNGEEVTDAYNKFLPTPMLLQGGYNYNHSDVHLWYHGTIDTDDPVDDGTKSVPVDAGWYDSDLGPRNEVGFNLSRIAGVTQSEPTDFINAGAWANIGYLDLTSTAVSQGGSVSIQYYYDVPGTGAATVSFYLDDNQNPYGNYAADLGSKYNLTSTSVTKSIFTGSVSTDVAAGTYYVYGKITYGGKNRYFYADEQLDVSEQIFTITASSGTHGDIVSLGGVVLTSVQVADGGTYTFYADPDVDYIVDKWYFNSTTPVQTGGDSYTTPSVYDNAWVQVKFKEDDGDGSITVTAPASGANYGLGTNMRILWDAGELEGDVKLELYRGSTCVDVIVDDADDVSASRGRHLYKIPKSNDDVFPADNYRVKITSLDDTSVTSYSGYFSIVYVQPGEGPIPISTTEELQKIGTGETLQTSDGKSYVFSADAHYVLEENLDFDRGVTFTPLCSDRYFEGIFDGQNHWIEDLVIDCPDAEEVGLFSDIRGNAIVMNVYLHDGHIEGNYRVGAIAGQSTGTIINCHSSSYVEGNDSDVGGLVGMNGGVIRNCSTSTHVSTNTVPEVKGYYEVGGVVGNNGQSGIVEWCWFTGSDVEGQLLGASESIGGIVGSNHGTIQECFVEGSEGGYIRGSEETGGIAGSNSAVIIDSYAIIEVHGSNDRWNGGVAGVNSGMISNCYATGPIYSGWGGGLIGHNVNAISTSFWDIEVSNRNASQGVDSGGGTVTDCFGKLTTEMMQQSTYDAVGWDFENIWTIDEGNDYPRLLGAKESLEDNPGSVTASDDLRGKVVISWETVAEAGAYGVYRADSADGIPNLLDYTNELSYEDFDALPDEPYYYFVTAAYTIGGAGETDVTSANSDEGTCLFQPDAPEHVNASSDLDNMIFVEWTGVPGADYYRVYRSLTVDGEKAPQTDWLETASSYFDEDTTMGQDYYYWIKSSTDANGETESDFSEYAIGREGEPEIRIEPVSYDFGRHNIGGSPFVTITIYNDGDAKLIISEAAGLLEPFQLSPTNDEGDTDDWSISINSSRDFTIFFMPVSGGPFEDDLTLHTNDLDTEELVIPVLGTANHKPTAVIDSITNNPVKIEDEYVSFEGTGTDVEPDGSIVSYEWHSSKNGLLSISEDFEMSAEGLSIGEHTISFRVTDNEGADSDWATTTLTVEGAYVVITESDASTDVAEGGATDTYEVVLMSQPTADVTITVTTNDQVEVDQSPLTFTSDNWDDPQTVTVTAVDDDYDEDDLHSGTIAHTASSEDERYDGDNIEIDGVTATVTDDDTAGVTVAPIADLITTEEGGTDKFTVVLDSKPTADVTINLSSSDTTEGTVSPETLLFEPEDWDTPIQVTITGEDDPVADGDIAYTIVTSATSDDPKYGGIPVNDVSVTNLDDEVPGVTVAPTSGLVTTEDGDTATFTVVLDSKPTANVTINLSSSDTTEGTVSTTVPLLFEPGDWDTPIEVTVTGEDDDVADGDVAYTIITSATSDDPIYDGIEVNDVSLINCDMGISSVVFAEAGTGSNHDGIMDSGDKLVITWATPDGGKIESYSLYIEGANGGAVNGLNVYGPFGDNFCGVFGPLDAGEYNFTIRTKDDAGDTFSYDGNFQVEQGPDTGKPNVFSVLVAEADRSIRDGTLQSNEKLVITWTAADPDGIGRQSIMVDGRTSAPVWGPYGENYCGVFGPMAAGEHRFTINSTDTTGQRTDYTGYFNVGQKPIFSVVIAEDFDQPRDGLLRSDEQLVLTWAVADAGRVAARNLWIDDRLIAPVYGPFGNAFAGRLGSLSAGTHEYAIEVIDRSGTASREYGKFHVAAFADLAPPLPIIPIPVLDAAFQDQDGSPLPFGLEATLGGIGNDQTAANFSAVADEVFGGYGE